MHKSLKNHTTESAVMPDAMMLALRRKAAEAEESAGADRNRRLWIADKLIPVVDKHLLILSNPRQSKESVESAVKYRSMENGCVRVRTFPKKVWVYTLYVEMSDVLSEHYQSQGYVIGDIKTVKRSSILLDELAISLPDVGPIIDEINDAEAPQIYKHYINE